MSTKRTKLRFRFTRSGSSRGLPPNAMNGIRDFVRSGFARHEGYLFLIAPSSGPIHAYPVDCYRFHPDGFRALAKHSGCRLIELWNGDRGPGNDLVGVFRHAEAPLPSAAEIAHNLAAEQLVPEAGHRPSGH